MKRTRLITPASSKNTKLDHSSIVTKLQQHGIAELETGGDIHNSDALIESHTTEALADMAWLASQADPTTPMRRPPTANERLAFNLPSDATVVVSVDTDGCLFREYVVDDKASPSTPPK